MLIQYTYLKGKMLMLNFDRKMKLKGRNIILIHTYMIWGHLDEFFSVLIYYQKKNTLLFNPKSLL